MPQDSGGIAIPAAKKILLVEDEAIIALSQEQKLKRFGYEAESALSGEAAIESVRADGNISLVLMDIDLGRGMDGTEAARRILAERKLPIVFLTSHSEREMVEKVRGITRYGYVIKNSGDFVLQSSIEMAFELFDAHERAQAEENRLRTLVQTIPDLVWLKDAEGVYLRCNGMFERFFGAKEADIVGKTDYDFVDAELASFFRERDRVAMEAGEPTVNTEWITFADTGERAFLETIKTPMVDERGSLVGILGVARNITAHKRAETALEKSREALEISEKAVRTKLEKILAPAGDIEGLSLRDIIDAPLIQRVMDDFYTLTGMNIGLIDVDGTNIVSTGWQDICKRFHRAHPESRRHCMESNEELAERIAPGTFKEYRCKNNLWDVATPIYIGGSYMGNIKTGQFFFDDEGIDREAFRKQARRYGFDQEEYLAALDKVPRFSRERVRATMRFYTELALIIGNLSYSNIRLARMVTEKEVLLRELKHRVKNSLSIVSSLLSLNRDVSTDKETSRVFTEAIGRVKSVSAIYDQLNLSEKLDSIEIDEYLRDLVGMIGKSYLDAGNGISFSLDIERKSIPLKTAVPIGLILNELVTNAIKYAYPRDSQGIIRIGFATDGDEAALTVSDDGVGLPIGFDPETTESLGLRISGMLAKQIGGKLRFSDGGGTTVVVGFKL